MRKCLKCNRLYEGVRQYCPADGRTIAEADPLVGRVLDGRYRIEVALGRGAMGVVYRACQLGVDRPVAIKVLHGELCARPTIVRRFHREARAMARLDHSGIATVYAVGESEEGQPFFVMEYVEGRPLSDYAKRPLAPDVARKIVAQVARALAHAHSAGIVHRDLKPANILIDSAGDDVRVKVLDFGIAKLLAAEGESEDLTRAGELFGTPQYLSPEQAVGGEVDARSDLYSLGVVLFELMTGNLPFGGDGMSVLVEHLFSPVPSLQGRFGALGELTERLLDKEPGRRPQSAACLLSELDWIGEKEGAQAPALVSHTVPAASRAARSRRPSSVLVAASLLLALALVGLSAGSGEEPRGQRSSVRQRDVARRRLRTPANPAPTPAIAAPRQAHVVVEADYSLRVLVPQAPRAGRVHEILIEAWDAHDRPLEVDSLSVRVNGRETLATRVSVGLPGQYRLSVRFERSGTHRLDVWVASSGPALSVHVEALDSLSAPSS